MILIDFNATARRAFAQGFLKGLGAPLVLFGTFESTAIPEMPVVTIPNVRPSDAIAGDWAKIGVDIRTASNRYGQEIANSK